MVDGFLLSTNSKHLSNLAQMPLPKPCLLDEGKDTKTKLTQTLNLLISTLPKEQSHSPGDTTSPGKFSISRSLSERARTSLLTKPGEGSRACDAPLSSHYEIQPPQHLHSRAVMLLFSGKPPLVQTALIKTLEERQHLDTNMAAPKSFLSFFFFF